MMEPHKEEVFDKRVKVSINFVTFFVFPTSSFIYCSSLIWYRFPLLSLRFRHFAFLVFREELCALFSLSLLVRFIITLLLPCFFLSVSLFFFFTSLSLSVDFTQSYQYLLDWFMFHFVLLDCFCLCFFINRQACIFTWIQWFCDVCYMIRDLEHDLKRYDSHKSISPHAEDRKNPKRTWHGNGNSVKVFVNPYIHRHISVYVHPKYWVRGSGCTFV